MTYTAADFKSDTPPPRPIGSEMEYDIQGPKGTAQTILSEGSEVLGYKHIGRYHGFMPNGARMYTDVDHLEYATPECIGGKQLALAEHAGRTIVKNIAENATTDHGGVYERVVAVNPIDETEPNKTRGYHENYTVPRSTDIYEKIEKYLPTFLATRIIWSGSGYVDRRGYRISQKASGIGKDFNIGVESPTNHGKKLMVAITDEGGDNHITRCEIRAMDPTRSWFAKRLSFNATSLCLRMLESDSFDISKRLPRIVPAFAAQQQISSDPSLQTRLRLMDGSYATAAEIQLRYAEAAWEYSEQSFIPDEEKQAAHQWRSLSKQLCKVQGVEDLSQFSKKIEWVARMKALERILGMGSAMQFTKKSVYLDHKWDRIDIHDIGRLAFAHDFSDTDDAAVQQYITTAPSNTRASVRGPFITSKNERSLEFIGWSYIKFIGDNRLSFDPWYTESVDSKFYKAS